MIAIYLIGAILGLEMAAFGALVLYKCWLGLKKPKEDRSQKETRQKQEALEKAWADGVSAISGYDINVARKAVRTDGEAER